MEKTNCKWNDGDTCNKGLPGTPCDIYGCVAFTKKEEEDEIHS